MFLPFLAALRDQRVPVSIGEWLSFLDGLSRDLALYDVGAFYHLARLTLVKDERHIDRFDVAFAQAFAGLESITPDMVLEALDLPPDWLTRMAERHLTEEEKRAIESLGGFDKLMETLRQRLAEQKGRHQGGSKWVGTAGTSPFGAWGFNPEGVRIGQDTGRHGRAAKVWDKREFRNLDDDVEIGTRTIKLALRRLRAWAREGAAEELDLDGTIRATADHGWLDVQTRPERRNAVRVLLFLDVGGSMDAHVRLVEELFSAARSEFRHLVPVYFHNCLYESVWRDNRRRWDEQVPTWDLIHRHGPGWRCIIVGDATMSPYEITHPGGANEHWNAESGATWLARVAAQWPRLLWINPVPQAHWATTPSIGLVQEAIGPGRMVPLTLAGLSRGMATLTR